MPEIVNSMVRNPPSSTYNESCVENGPALEGFRMPWISQRPGGNSNGASCFKLKLQFVPQQVPIPTTRRGWPALFWSGIVRGCD